MKKVITFIGLAMLLTLCAAPVYAQPALPHAFYGTVTINGGAPADDDTLISATVDEGVTLTTNKNPVATEGGSYGINSPKLLVQGDGLSGAITFYVKGYEAVPSETVTFEAGGGPTRVDLSVTIEAEEPVVYEPGAGGGVPPAYVETTIFGIEERFRISDEGEILKTIEATSEDGMLTMTIPKGTIALDKDGDPLEELEAAIDESPPFL